MSEQSPPKKRSLKPFWILLAISGLPYLASWIYYSNMDTLPVPEASNNGELIEPLRPIGQLSLKTLEGESLETDDLKGNWTLATVGNSDCKEDCQRSVFFITQVRRLMGKERNRIRRLFVLLDKDNLSSFEQGIKQYEGVEVIDGTAGDAAALLAHMTINETNPQDRIFIIDPLDNLMMVYDKGADPVNIAKDFRRLLTVTRIGQPKETTL